MKLKHPLLLLSLLAAAAAAAAEFNGHKAPVLRRRSDSAVKLCGHDFIRAVHFNCGASRSKKRSESQAAEKRLLAGFVLPTNYKGMEDPKERSSFDFSKREIEDEIWQYISELVKLRGSNGLLRKRDYSAVVADRCCKKGCTIAEINTLC